MRLTDLLLKSKLPVRELTDEESNQLKNTMLEMYKDILVVCKKYNLIAFLGGGSCLGAIRHKGYIPWDDDLDLLMLRNDYDKLPKALLSEFPGKYEIIGHGSSEKFEYPFIKILKKGTLLRTIYDYPEEKPMVWVDVFPVENIPDNRIKRFIHGIRCNFFMYMALCTKLYQRRTCPFSKLLLSTKDGKRQLYFRFFIGKLFCFKPYQKWYEKFDRIAKKYMNKKTNFTAIPTGRKHYFGEIFEKSDILPTADCEFEGVKSVIYGNYKKYLSNLYGDYMQIPPEDKREKHFIVEIKFQTGGN